MRLSPERHQRFDPARRNGKPCAAPPGMNGGNCPNARCAKEERCTVRDANSRGQPTLRRDNPIRFWPASPMPIRTNDSIAMNLLGQHEIGRRRGSGLRQGPPRIIRDLPSRFKK